MVSKKIFLVLLMLIAMTTSVFASITFIDGRDKVSLLNSDHKTTVQFDVSSLGTYNISNEADVNIDFNVTKLTFVNINIEDIDYLDEPYIEADGTPVLPSELDDNVTITGPGGSAIVTIDSTRPVNDATLTVTATTGGLKYLDFYSGVFRVTPSGSITDSGTGIDNYIFYLTPISDLNDYANSYTKLYAKETFTYQEINSLATPKIADGNYYVVIDANDNAENYTLPDEVKATKKPVYVDNSAPTLKSVTTSAVGTITNNKLYSKDRSFPLTVVLDDASGIASGAMTVSVSGYYGYSKQDTNYNSGFSLTADEIAHIVQGFVAETGDIYLVNVNATDNVGNEYDYNFSIIIDLDAPSIPTSNTLTIEDIDKNVTISFGGSSDTGGSLFKEYRVYRGTSLVCTLATAGSCKDSTSKSSDTTISYGVVGVDNAGNVSDANTQSIWTGPKMCTVKINTNAEYTNVALANLTIDDYDNDVNEMAFSCNNTTFSAYSPIGDENTFNITTGSGCTTTNGEKSVYVRVKSEEQPTRTTTCSDTIYFDNTAPTLPTNLKATPQSDGSAKLTWTASTDANPEFDVKYKIYYSTDSTVPITSSYRESTTNTYTFSSNTDANLYFKVSALDELNNESALSAAVFANVKKIGPRFVITIDPSNDLNGLIYVSSGSKTINFVSDETLVGNPIITVKQGTGNPKTIIGSYDNTTKIGVATFTATTAGAGIVKITGSNTIGEQATSEYVFTIDTTAIDFNYSYILQDPITYKIGVSNLSTDVFKVEYVIDNLTTICSKQQVTDYNCTYDTRTTPDGDHTMYINVYDKALNKNTKSFTFIVDNIDEDKVFCDQLRADITLKLKTISDNLEWYKAIDIFQAPEQTINEKMTKVNTARSAGNDEYAQGEYLLAKANYQLAETELDAIAGLIPAIETINTKFTRTTFDENTVVPIDIIIDQNLSAKTKLLYAEKSITIDRNFDVLKIANENFFSVTLTVNNTSNSAKTVTIIEEIPKSFANNISKLIFNKQVEIMVKDPVVKYTMTIPANSSDSIVYKSLNPATLIDITTKYEEIKFTNPILIDGNATKDQLNIKQPINTTVLIYLFSIIIIFVILVIGIGAISNYKKKKKVEDVKPDAKKMMSDYLGTNEKEKLALDNTNQSKPKEAEKKVEEKQPEEKKRDMGDKFNEDYQYILSAIKKR